MNLYNVVFAAILLTELVAGSTVTKSRLAIVRKKPLVSRTTIKIDEDPRLINNANDEEGAPIPSLIFNLVKSIVGAGVLGLPAGIAAVGNAPSALVPAVTLIFGIGMLSSYGFSLIGRVCAYTQARSYREAWEKSVGESTSWIPALFCTLVTSCSVLAYSMILSDTFPQLLEIVDCTVSRTQSLFSVTLLILLPLCLMKSLSSLAPFSLVGILAMLYTSVAMGIRYFGGAYKEGGILLEQVAENLRPTFGDVGARGALQPNIFLLICMLSTAFMAHYSSPRFYLELRNNTIPRFNTVVRSSFLISILIFSAVASLGFLTFGAASSGVVLNNYSTKDTLASLSRVAVVLSLLFSYPLAFQGVRSGVLDLVGYPEEKRSNRLLDITTISILSIITCLAYVSKDLTILLALNGATVGNALIYLIPTTMFLGCARRLPELRSEIPFAVGTALLGLGFGIVGTIKAIKSMGSV